MSIKRQNDQIETGKDCENTLYAYTSLKVLFLPAGQVSHYIKEGVNVSSQNTKEIIQRSFLHMHSV